MAFAKVFCAQHSLLKAHIVDVEVDISKGLHLFSIVGLPDKGVEEARDRVSAAIKNSGYPSPKSTNQKITVSLAPADVKKEGPLFDLAIALGYLLSTEQIAFDPKNKLFLGELALDGTVRPVRGVLALTQEAKKLGFTEIYVPKENAREAALIDGVSIFGVKNLKEVINHLTPKVQFSIPQQEKTALLYLPPKLHVDWSDVRGQDSTKRGLEIAAAGGHNIAMYGPPGTGKTMLARAFTGILPPLSFNDVLEITAIHSIAGTLQEDLITNTPFRSPHHTSSYVSLIGGGTTPKPGEVTLAHRGVLFLDEFPEFDRRVIESLREPLEDRVVTVSRAKGTARFPAEFILIAAMNPCPCGNFGVTGKRCACPAYRVEQYRKKISGPIVDRIDLWLETVPVKHSLLSAKREGESSETVKERIVRARDIQATRFKNTQLRLNAQMSSRDIETFANLEPKALETLTKSAGQLGLSARAFHRVIKLARTIADLADSKNITERHIFEALQYRPKSIA